MEPIQYDQFKTSDNEGGQERFPQRGFQVKVVYLLYGVVILLQLILLMVTGLKLSQLNQDLADVKLSLETIDTSVSARANQAVSFNFEDIPTVSERGPCDEGWIHFQSSCYLMSKSKADWNEAERLCVSHGAHLAVINTMEELKYLSRFSHDQLQYWIGLHDIVKEGQWTWIDGTAFQTPNLWDVGQPDNYDYGVNGEDCGQLHPTKSYSPNFKLFNDSDCTQEFRYICEATGK